METMETTPRLGAPATAPMPRRHAGVASVPRAAAAGIASSVRARPGLFVSVFFTMLAVHVFLPPLILSVTRKPMDYATFNPWLTRLPEYLGSAAPPGEKIEKLWRLALFWFSSTNSYGVEWGFAVDAGDVVRMTFASLVIATFFAVSAFRPRFGTGKGAGRRTGVLGAVASLLGLSTGPCSVMGCGAPVIPVLGLAFAGLSSTTLALLHDVSTWATPVILTGMTLGVLVLGWSVGRERPLAPASPPRLMNSGGTDPVEGGERGAFPGSPGQQ